MQVHTPSRSEFAHVRGLRYHLRRWGNPAAPTLFLLHGWMEVSATFQFVVDQLQGEWNIIAPDWRGCGESEWLHQPYWYGDLIADLDDILAQFSPGQAALIVGHSMGGNIGALYAGARPTRVAKLVTLEGIGHWTSSAGETVASYVEWLDAVRGPISNPVFSNRAELAGRLMRANPRLDAGRAEFLAQHFGRDTSDGLIEPAVDPYHRLTFSHLLHRNADFMACWGNISAPVLWVAARDSAILKRLGHDDPPGSAYDYAARLASFAKVRAVMLDDAGHNMQHDQPAILARLVEQFLLGGPEWRPRAEPQSG